MTARPLLSILRRSYATATSTPSTAQAAQKASLPLQVALRRSQSETPDADQDRARYELLRSKGELLPVSGEVPTYKEWLQRTSRRRRRVRGTKTVNTSSAETQVVGQKIYLPNTIFRLMRNNTPPGQAYNPYEATFRVPRAITKNDIRSYLDAAYGVKTTYIRTDNYIAPLKRQLVDGHRAVSMRSGGMETTYKRAVVGLVEPFVYPVAVEDMTQAERKEHKDWMEKMFQVEAYKEFQRTRKLDPKTGRITKRAMTNRGRILELVMQKRKEKEDSIRQKADVLVSSGASPFGRRSSSADSARAE